MCWAGILFTFSPWNNRFVGETRDELSIHVNRWHHRALLAYLKWTIRFNLTRWINFGGMGRNLKFCQINLKLYKIVLVFEIIVPTTSRVKVYKRKIWSKKNVIQTDFLRSYGLVLISTVFKWFFTQQNSVPWWCVTI